MCFINSLSQLLMFDTMSSVLNVCTGPYYIYSMNQYRHLKLRT
ncbi:9888_t:CDS:2 [Funneliformis caledonium]|uniref:9888_t:CDS:1 n=1 Tax=Funneliformis caledonium TaxID=1117310 RepID=A0A9N9A7M0_9GLOM|nr:9888_t:CDS:2 [Funneliformis caledonium]